MNKLLALRWYFAGALFASGVACGSSGSGGDGASNDGSGGDTASNDGSGGGSSLPSCSQGCTSVLSLCNLPASQQSTCEQQCASLSDSQKSCVAGANTCAGVQDCMKASNDGSGGSPGNDGSGGSPGNDGSGGSPANGGSGGSPGNSDNGQLGDNCPCTNDFCESFGQGSGCSDGLECVGFAAPAGESHSDATCTKACKKDSDCQGGYTCTNVGINGTVFGTWCEREVP